MKRFIYILTALWLTCNLSAKEYRLPFVHKNSNKKTVSTGLPQNVLLPETSGLDWFYAPPKPTRDYYYTIGISDPDLMDKDFAVKQAKTRACLVYCLLNKAIILTKGDNYYQSSVKQKTNQYSHNGKFYCLSLSSGKISRPEVIKIYTNDLGETILLVRFNIKAEDDLIDFDLATKDELTSNINHKLFTDTITSECICKNPTENIKLKCCFSGNIQDYNSEIHLTSALNNSEYTIQPVSIDKYKLKEFYEDDFTNIDRQFVPLRLGLWNAYYTGIKQFLWLQSQKIYVKGVTDSYSKIDPASNDTTYSFESISRIQDSLNVKNFYVKHIGVLGNDLGVSVLNTDTALNSISYEKTVFRYVATNQEEVPSIDNLPFSEKKYKTDSMFFRKKGAGKSRNAFIAQMTALHNGLYSLAEFVQMRLPKVENHTTETHPSDNNTQSSTETLTRDVTNISFGYCPKINTISYIDNNIYEARVALEYPRLKIVNELTDIVSGKNKGPVYNWNRFLMMYMRGLDSCNH